MIKIIVEVIPCVIFPVLAFFAYISGKATYGLKELAEICLLAILLFLVEISINALEKKWLVKNIFGRKNITRRGLTDYEND